MIFPCMELFFSDFPGFPELLGTLIFADHDYVLFYQDSQQAKNRNKGMRRDTLGDVIQIKQNKRKAQFSKLYFQEPQTNNKINPPSSIKVDIAVSSSKKKNFLFPTC